jgi:transposase
MKRVYHIGLDIGPGDIVGACINADGDLLWKKTVTPGEKNLIDLVVTEKGEVYVIFEEGEMAGWVYRTIKPYVTKVIVCEPKQNAWIAKASNKSDKVDCEKLARLHRLNEYKEVFQPENDVMATFKKVVQHEDEMVKRAVRLKVQIKAKFRREGVFCKGRGVYGERGSADALNRLSDQTIKAIIEQDIRLLSNYREEIKKARELVKSLSKDMPIVRHFENVPGIGPKLSSRFVAYVQTPYRFSSKRKLIRYSKLGIIDRSSDGKPLGRKRLEPSGNGALKDLSRKAFKAAMRASDDNLFKRAYHNSCMNTHNPVHARLTVQRKILSVLYAMWRDGTEFEDDIDAKPRA